MRRNPSVYACFREQVDRFPDHRAVFDSESSLTYRQLDRLAGSLSGEFPDKVSFIGVVMDHGPEMIASILAVLRAGAAYVPAEPDFPTERIRHMMKECDVNFILTQRKYADRLRDFRLVFVERDNERSAGKSTPEKQVDPHSLAYVLYTSGSTGVPKGVAVEHRNVCHYVQAFNDEFRLSAEDVMLQYSVCSFDIFVEEVFTTLLSGAALAIPPPAAREDIRMLMHFVGEHGVTVISGFPYLLLEMNRLERIPPGLRLLISGGDVLRKSYVDRLLHQAEVYNTYGPSETTVCASYFRCNGAEACGDGTYPIGRAVTGVRIIVLDDELHPVEAGRPGEIAILGGGVSRGYLGNKAAENTAFVLWQGERLYLSGDRGLLLPDGNLAFLGRKDAQVMIRGRRVEPSEVENVLCTCNEVEQAVVVAHTDEQGLAYLTAYLVPRNKDFNLSLLKEKMARFLPGYMIPEFFVRTESLPHTPNGKVNAKALPIVLKEGDL
jgi:amino acid adenylation domain-containing protein